jgi:transcriptional regulator with XRE-family HTH domain
MSGKGGCRVPSKPDRVPNDLLLAARLARRSPSGSGRPMSRQEVGEGVAAAIYAASGQVVSIGPEYIARLERGEMRWPSAARRAAFRAFFGVDSDAALGFFITRPQPSAARLGHQTVVESAPRTSADAINAARIDLGRQLAALREAALMTQAALGRRLAYSRTTIASVETGQRDATRQFWERADRELNASGVLVKAFDELDDLNRMQRDHERHPRHRHGEGPAAGRAWPGGIQGSSRHSDLWRGIVMGQRMSVRASSGTGVPVPVDQARIVAVRARALP